MCCKTVSKSQRFFKTKPTDVEIKSQQKNIDHKKNIPRFLFLTFFIHTKISPTQFIDICLLIFYIKSMTILILTLIVIMVIIAIAIAIVNLLLCN